MALLERERERGREGERPTLTLEPCTNAWTLVVGLLAICRQSVSRSLGVASSNVSATVSITTHQSPVDPADHDTTEQDGFGGSPEGYYPTSARCTLVVSQCLSFVLSSLIGRSLSTDTPVGSLSHTNALSSLSPTTREMWQ